MNSFKKIIYFSVFQLIILSSITTAVAVSSLRVISSVGSIRYGLSFLSVSGRQVVDGRGEPITLRGVNVFSSQVFSQTDADYSLMEKWGVNVIRFQISWSKIEPKPGYYDSSYLDKIEYQISLMKKHGIYILIDMHQCGWSSHFTFFGTSTFGVPTWLVKAYPDNQTGYDQAVTDFWKGKGANGTMASATNPSMMDMYIRAWVFVAKRFFNESMVMGYDLMNEPPRGQLTHTEHANIMYPFYEKLATEIRKIDAKHILNYQPTSAWATQYARQLGPNMMLSFHFYNLKDNYDGNASNLEKNFLEKRWNPIKDWTIPIWVTETGVELFRPNYNLWLNDTLTILSKYNLGWTYEVYGRGNPPGYFLLYANGTEKTELTSIIKPFF